MIVDSRQLQPLPAAPSFFSLFFFFSDETPLIFSFFLFCCCLPKPSPVSQLRRRPLFFSSPFSFQSWSCLSLVLVWLEALKLLPEPLVSFSFSATQGFFPNLPLLSLVFLVSSAAVHSILSTLSRHSPLFIPAVTYIFLAPQTLAANPF